jgi:hypothetical protein
VVTISWPEETARLKPKPRRARSIAENTEPEWVISATGPAGTGSGSTYPMARRPRATFTNPMHPAPHTAIWAGQAIAASRSRSPGGPDGGSPVVSWSRGSDGPDGGSKALPKMTAERSPLRAAWAS